MNENIVEMTAELRHLSVFNTIREAYFYAEVPLTKKHFTAQCAAYVASKVVSGVVYDYALDFLAGKAVPLEAQRRIA